jgi:hypothetical protein
LTKALQYHHWKLFLKDRLCIVDKGATGVDRSAKAHQEAAALKAPKEPSHITPAQVVLRSSCSQARMVVTDDDLPFHNPHFRADVSSSCPADLCMV